MRELAQALAVNPMTVSKAFSLLESEGVLEQAAASARQLELPHEQALSLFDDAEPTP